MFNSDMPVIRDENMYMKAAILCKDGINIADENAVEFDMELKNQLLCQQWLNIRIFMPEEWDCSIGKEFAVNLDQLHAGYGRETISFQIVPHNITSAKTTIVMEISSVGKLTNLYIPITLLRAPQDFRTIE